MTRLRTPRADAENASQLGILPLRWRACEIRRKRFATTTEVPVMRSPGLRLGLLVASPALILGGAFGCSRRPPAIETTGQEVITATQINGNSLPAKTVVLTYDDGPDEHTLELAHYLADQGVKVTFFVNGRRYCKTLDATGACTVPQETRACNDGQSQAAVPGTVKHYPESMIDEILALGHRIGNHTQDHCHLPGQTKVPDLAFEFKATQDILDRHICDNVFLFRAPFGEWDGNVVSRINSQMGFSKIVGPINWDVDGNDWDCWQKGTKPADCANGYMNILNARPNKNGIFLMHDRPEFNVGYDGPVQMTKILVPRLKAEGFKFATMDDVLKLTPNPMGSGCPNNAPADAGAVKDGGGDAVSSADAGPSGGSSGQDSGVGSGGSGGARDPDQTGSGGASASGGAGAGSGGSSGSSSGDAGPSGSGGRASGGSSGKGGNTAPDESQPQDGGGCSTGGGGSRPAAPLGLLLGFVGVGLARLRRRRR
jgi:peptidoglycan/xylan/chitin deacetylase (PgdA/CDA1 family)